jgi:hypothetical protein
MISKTSSTPGSRQRIGLRLIFLMLCFVVFTPNLWAQQYSLGIEGGYRAYLNNRQIPFRYPLELALWGQWNLDDIWKPLQDWELMIDGTMALLYGVSRDPSYFDDGITLEPRVSASLRRTLASFDSGRRMFIDAAGGFGQYFSWYEFAGQPVFATRPMLQIAAGYGITGNSGTFAALGFRLSLLLDQKIQLQPGLYFRIGYYGDRE